MVKVKPFPLYNTKKYVWRAKKATMETTTVNCYAHIFGMHEASGRVHISIGCPALICLIQDPSGAIVLAVALMIATWSAVGDA